MSRNIKEIGKELMGKSLNSFHRKTGLTQLEENNKMQDGILNGILSQVDDAYIEKTEQSNVIHLDGSGDGVVVVDSIEGNTMVNMVKSYNTNDFVYSNAIMQSDGYFKIQYGRDVNASYVRPKLGIHTYKPNTQYTVIVDIKENTCGKKLGMSAIHSAIQTLSPRDFQNTLGISTSLITTRSDINIDDKGNPTRYDLYFGIWEEDGGDLSKHITFRYWILEGDWRNKELPPYFTGLQSSFEEKVNDEGKYEIEILSQNKNLWNGNLYSGWGGDTPIMQELGSRDNIITDFIRVEKNTTYYINIPNCTYSWLYDKDKKLIKSNLGTINAYIDGTDSEDAHYMIIGRSVGTAGIYKDELKNVMISKVKNEKYIPQKQNKIKLLINEPLRSVGDIKDRLVSKDNKLMVERNFIQVIVDGESLQNYNNFAYRTLFDFKCNALQNWHLANFITDSKFKNTFIDYQWNHRDFESIAVSPYGEKTCIDIIDKSISFSVNSYKEILKEKPIKVVCQLLEPYYEEVLNEYGEPILLEGYENGTIYIDSTIVPTTTVRYTPKMESFKTLKEVENNNIMLTNDVNDNIIPYMMDVDLMIMEKEMALMSQYKIRRIGAKDMTSMQKRTQDMLTRLIKGKTLTEQECKTRVVTYLDAGKITDAQADELMLLISEVYA